MKSLKAIIDRLREAERVLLISHINPDFDAVGSMLGFKGALEKAGKAVTCLNETGPSPNMLFLPGARDVVRKVHPLKRFDMSFALDANQPDRFGDILMTGRSLKRLGTIVKVDHHLDGEAMGDLEYTDKTCSSTAELVLDIIRHYPVEPDTDIALNLYCALVSDTGGFRYSNTNRRTFLCAAELLEYGVDPWYVTTQLYENRPASEIRLLTEVLNTLELSPCGRIAGLSVSRAAMKRNGAQEYVLDGFVNFGRAIKDVEVAMLLKERDPGDVYHVSIRSKGRVNVARIAQSFGGGGHHNAAGCTVEGHLDEVKKKLFDSATRRLARSKQGSGRKKAAVRRKRPNG